MFLLEKALSVIAPHNCIVCEAEGAVVCAYCLPDVAPPLPSRCYACFSLTLESATCAKCRNKSRPKNVWVVTKYEEGAKELIHDLKFARKRQAHKPIAELIADLLPDLPDMLVVHVPTATSRRRQRGYDQSELIAKAIARQKGLRHDRLLRRIGQTRQVGSDKKARKQHMKNSFITTKQLDKQTPILLVDDLLTTGATIESATLALKEAGAKKVYAAVFAQRV